MAQYALPTGEVVSFNDDTDEHEVLDLIEQTYLSPEATQDSVIGSIHRANAARNENYDPTQWDNQSFYDSVKKYDNRERAVMAHVWGEDNMDKWLENGSRPEEVPKHVREYTDQVVNASTPVEDVWAIKRGFLNRFGGGNASMAGHALQAFGDVGDVESLRNLGADLDQYGRDTQRPYQLKVPSLADIKGVTDFFTYVGEGIGEFAGTFAPQLVIGGAGAAAGAVTPVPGGAALGALAGAASTSYAMAIGEIRESAMNDPAIQEKLRNGDLTHFQVSSGAIAFGVPVAALDTFSFGKATNLTKAARKKIIMEPYKNFLLKHAGKSMGREAWTEALQETINNNYTNIMGGAPWDAKDTLSILDSAAKGGIGGGVMGVGGGGYKAVRQSRQNKLVKRLEDLRGKPAPVIYGEPPEDGGPDILPEDTTASIPDSNLADGGSGVTTDEQQAFFDAMDEWNRERGFTETDAEGDSAPQPAAVERLDDSVGEPTTDTIDIDAMRAAGFTDAEIRNPKNVDPRKIRQASEGYAYIQGEWRKPTQEDVENARADGVGEKKLREQQLQVAVDKHGFWDGKIANIFGSDSPAMTFEEATQFATARTFGEKNATNLEAQMKRQKPTEAAKPRTRKEAKRKAAVKAVESKKKAREAVKKVKELEAQLPTQKVDPKLRQTVEQAQSVASDRTDSTPIVPVNAENTAKLQLIRRQQLEAEAARQRKEDAAIMREAQAEIARAVEELKQAQEAALAAKDQAEQDAKKARTKASKDVEAAWRMMLDDFLNHDDSRFPDVVALATALDNLGFDVNADTIGQIAEGAARARKAATILNSDIAPYLRRELDRLAPTASKMLNPNSDGRALGPEGYSGFYDPVLHAIANSPVDEKTWPEWKQQIITVGGKGYYELLEEVAGGGFEFNPTVPLHKSMILTLVRNNQVVLVDYVSDFNAPESPSNMGRRWTISGDPVDYKELHIAVPNFAQGEGWRDGHSFIDGIDNPIARVRFHTVADVNGDRVLLMDELQPPTKINFNKMPEYLQRRWDSIAMRRMLNYASHNGFAYIAWPNGDVIAQRTHHAFPAKNIGILRHHKTGQEAYLFTSFDEPQQALSPAMLKHTNPALFDLVQEKGKEKPQVDLEKLGVSTPLDNIETRTIDLNTEHQEALDLSSDFYTLTYGELGDIFPAEMQGPKWFADNGMGGMLLDPADIPQEIQDEVLSQESDHTAWKDDALILGVSLGDSTELLDQLAKEFTYIEYELTDDEIAFHPEYMVRSAGWQQQLYDKRLVSTAKKIASDSNSRLTSVEIDNPKHKKEIPYSQVAPIASDRPFEMVEYVAWQPDVLKLHALEVPLPSNMMPMKALARAPQPPVTPHVTDTRMVTNPWDHLSEVGEEREDHLDAALFEAIVEMAKRIAPGVKVKKADIHVAQRYGDDWAGLHAGSTIWLALQRLPGKGRRAPAAVFTAYHEMIHYLDEKGLLNDAKGIVSLNLPEAQALVAEYYDKFLGYSPEGIQRILDEMASNSAEALAYTGSVWMVQSMRADHNRLQRWPEPLRRVANQFVKFLKRLKNMLNKRGFNSLDQIFEEVRDGRRGAKLKHSQNPVAAQTASEAAQLLNMSDTAFQRWFQGSHMIDYAGRPTPGVIPTQVGDPSIIDFAGPLGPGVYIYDNPADAAQHAADTEAYQYLKDNMPEDMTNREMEAWRAYQEAGFQGPSTFPGIAVIKKPLYADRPITDTQRAWMLKELESLVELFKDSEHEGMMNDLIATIETAETLQDIINTNLPIITEFPLIIAKRQGRDGLRTDNAWIYLGEPAGIRSALETWRPANKSLIDQGRQLFNRHDETPLKYTAKPSTDLKWWQRWLADPRFNAKKNGFMAPVYMAGNLIKSHQAKIVQDAALKTRPYMRLPREERKQINRAMELARLNETKMKVGTDGDIVVVNTNGVVTDLNPRGTETVRITGEKNVAAAMEMQKLGEKMWDYMRDAFMSDQADTLNANGDRVPFDAEMSTPQIKELRENLKAWAQAAAELGSEDLQNKFDEERARIAEIYKAVKELESQRNRSTYVPLSRFGSYATVLEEYNDQKGRWEQTALITFEPEWGLTGKKLNMAKVNARIDEVLARNPGSRVRPPQSEGVAIYGREPDGSRGEELHWEKRRRGESAQDTIDRMRRTIPGQYEYVFEDRGEHVIFELTRDNITRAAGNPMVAMDMLAAQLGAQDRAKYEELQPVLAEMVRKRGFGTHLKQARFYDGYDSDFERAWGKYLMGVSGFISRMKHGKTINRALNQIPRDNMKLKEYADKYMRSIMDPQEDHKFLRSLSFFWYLGGNLSSAAIQLMNLPVYSAPHLAAIYGKTGGTMKELTNAFALASKIMAIQAKDKAWHYKEYKGEGVGDPFWNNQELRSLFRDDQEFEAVKRAWTEGYLSPMLMLQQVGHVIGNVANIPVTQEINLGNKFARGWMELQNLSSAPFGAMEKLARMTQFIASYRLAQDPAALAQAQKTLGQEHLFKEISKADNRDPAYNAAIYLIDDIMGQFDKTNRAPFEKGIGLLAFQFQSWVRQILWTLLSDMKGRGPAGKKAAAGTMAMLLVTTGYQGLPGAEDLEDIIEEIWKKIFGEDLDIQQHMKEFAENELGMTRGMTETLMKGAFRPFTDVSIERRIGLGRLPGSNLVGMFLGEGDAYDLMGPTGSTFFGAAQNYGRRRDGGEEWGTAALREFTPQFVKNGVNAYIWSDLGYKSQRGHMLVPSDKLSGYHLLAKAAGFNPAPAARASENRQHMRREAQDLGPAEMYRGRIVSAYTRMLEARRRGDVEEVRDARRDIDKILNKIRELNRTAKLEDRIRINLPGIQRSVLMNLNPHMRGILGAPLHKRRRLMEMSKGYE